MASFLDNLEKLVGASDADEDEKTCIETLKREVFVKDKNDRKVRVTKFNALLAQIAKLDEG